MLLAIYMKTVTLSELPPNVYNMMYRDQKTEFPAECREKDYERRITDYAPARLTLEILNEYVWKNANHIDLKTLWKYLTNYLYLPRLKNEQVLLDAIADGVGKDLCSWQENFAYASGFNEDTAKYLGLTAGQPIIPSFSSSNFLVKPEIALAQFKEDVGVGTPDPFIVRAEQEQRQKQEYTSNNNIGNGKAAQSTRSKYNDDSNSSANTSLPKSNSSTITIHKSQKSMKRFYGSVELDSERINRDASQIADEILQHLTSLVGANVKVTLEIEAEVESGIPEDVIRTIRENCHTLKFESQDFSED